MPKFTIRRSSTQKGPGGEAESERPTFEGALAGFGRRSESETEAEIEAISYILNHEMRDKPL